MALKNNTWTLNNWYAQDVAGNVSYTGAPGLYTWGMNAKGQLGNNQNGDSGPNYSSPIQITGTTWNALSTYVSGDTWQTLSSRTDGTLWAFGGNTYGQLGQNNRTDYSSPVQIPGSTWGTEIRSHQESSYVIKTDGTLWSWGGNSPSYGELGHNNKTDYSSPVQVGSDATWSTITTMGYGCITTKTDGTLWTWGANSFGMLGINNTTAYSSPKQVPGTTWTGDITGGSQFGAAIKTDGSLWMWGVNEYGMLGQNSKTNYSSPRQVGSETTWSNISSTQVSVAAVKTDGTLWVWGNNGSGRLGMNQGEPSQYSSPVQVPGTTWNRTQGGAYAMYATKTDGTLWALGSTNGQGQLGQNNTTNYSSPIQIPGVWNLAKNKIGTNYIGASAIANI